MPHEATVDSCAADCTLEPRPIEPRCSSYCQVQCCAYAEFKDTFNVGVIAFHKDGILLGEFAVSDGSVGFERSVTAPAFNPQTGVWEYWIPIEASYFKDGPIAVTAKAVPNSGLSRDLSLTLYANSRGGLVNPAAYVSPSGNDSAGNGSRANPYRTIDRTAAAIRTANGSTDGAFVYLEDGDYSAPSLSGGNNRWLTISGTPGSDPVAVKLLPGNGNSSSGRNRFAYLTLQKSIAGKFISGSGATWIDHVRILGPGRAAETAPSVNGGRIYYTSVSIADTAEGLDTWDLGVIELARDVHIERILENAFRMNTLIVNSSVRDVDPGTFGAHPDVIQVGPDGYVADNFIAYGLSVTNVRSQGGYINSHDWTLVNVLIQQRSDSSFNFYLDNSSNDHVLFWHMTLLNQTFVWRPGSQVALCRDINIKNSVLQNMTIIGTAAEQSALTAAIQADNNHYIAS